MYGTIARFRLKDGVSDDQIDELIHAMRDDAPRPSVAIIVYRSEEDPRTMWVAGAFESKEAYVANAESPEQKARFERIARLMEGAPEWHDGNVLFVNHRGVAVV